MELLLHTTLHERLILIDVVDWLLGIYKTRSIRLDVDLKLVVMVSTGVLRVFSSFQFFVEMLEPLLDCGLNGDRNHLDGTVFSIALVLYYCVVGEDMV